MLESYKSGNTLGHSEFPNHGREWVFEKEGVESSYGALMRRHYKEEAEKHGFSSHSTMEDEIVRAREIRLILAFLTYFGPKDGRRNKKVLDLGCGNAYTLNILSEAHKDYVYYGVDLSPELLTIAKKRKLINCDFLLADGCSIPFSDNSFNLIYTERCLINILDWEAQKSALHEIDRILEPGGHYLMIECFTDGMENLNRARQECGLEELRAAYHNKYFEKKAFFEFVHEKFSVIDPAEIDIDARASFQSNFLSSHYFIARVLHPLVTRGGNIKNTEFVKFFSFLPPIGNYSQIQAYILKKREQP